MKKIKIILGYNKHYSVSAEEAHKAYHIFMNPDKRAVFSNGIAIRGKDIMGIEPDYHSVFGWNESHKLEGDDWNEINRSSECIELKEIIADAKLIAQKPELLSIPFSEARQKMLN
jgi:hypothetical protein